MKYIITLAALGLALLFGCSAAAYIVDGWPGALGFLGALTGSIVIACVAIWALNGISKQTRKRNNE